MSDADSPNTPSSVFRRAWQNGHMVWTNVPRVADPQLAGLEPWAASRPRRRTSNPSRPPLPLTKWVSAKDVMHAVGCSRTMAYEHIHRAKGDEARTGEAVRVTVEQWERYAREGLGKKEGTACTSEEGERSSTPRSTWRGGASSAVPAARPRRRLGPFSGNGSARPPIPFVQPRTRR